MEEISRPCCCVQVSGLVVGGVDQLVGVVPVGVVPVGVVIVGVVSCDCIGRSRASLPGTGNRHSGQLF